MKSLRILVMTQHDLVPPDEPVEDEAVMRAPWKTDYDVVHALRDMGHETHVVGLEDDLEVLRASIDEHKPHLVFNLLEHFHQKVRFLPQVIGYLELIRQPYTGCNPVGMTFSTNKALQRKILRHHRIPVPEFMICEIGRKIRRPKRLSFPLIVKSLIEHGSTGIAHASVVHNDEKLAERVQYVHESIGTDAIAEEYIEGRELYLGVVGNERLETFPLWEMRLEQLRDGAPHIATHRIKWDLRYQERVGLSVGPAKDLPDGLAPKLVRMCKRAYRRLEQSGYARFDLRLAGDGRVVLIESNPNPDLSWDSEFPSAAKAAGYEYPQLLQRIIRLGLRWNQRLH